MTTQKTWTDLLGTYCADCYVVGKMIVRRVVGNRFRVMWTFDSKSAALAVYRYWKQESPAL
jgi:hypothetical protein